METPIELKPVKSSMFSHIGYNETNWVLCVVYKSSGLRLDYQQIPPELYDELMSAESFGGSIGKFFNANIKGKFSAIGEEVAKQAGDAPLEGGITDEDLAVMDRAWAKAEPRKCPKCGIGIDDNGDGDCAACGQVKAPAIPEVVADAVDALQKAAEKVSGADPKFVDRVDIYRENPDGSYKLVTSPDTAPAEVLSAWKPPENPVQAIIMLNDRAEEIQSIIKQNGEMARDAMSVSATDNLSYASAGQTLKILVSTKDRIFGLLDPIRDMLFKTYKAAGEKQTLALSALEGAINHVKTVMLRFEQQVEAERQRQIKAAREEADRVALAQQQEQSQQLTLAEVSDAIEEGDTERAEALIASPIQVPKPYVAPVMPEPEILAPAGTSTRDNWKVYEDWDAVKFLTAVKEGKLDIAKAVQFIKPDFPALNKLAKALRTAFDVPGFTAWNDQTKAVRRGK